jgi:uncharacterized membrane protein
VSGYYHLQLCQFYATVVGGEVTDMLFLVRLIVNLIGTGVFLYLSLLAFVTVLSGAIVQATLLLATMIALVYLLRKFDAWVVRSAGENHA